MGFGAPVFQDRDNFLDILFISNVSETETSDVSRREDNTAWKETGVSHLAEKKRGDLVLGGLDFNGIHCCCWQWVNERRDIALFVDCFSFGGGEVASVEYLFVLIGFVGKDFVFLFHIAIHGNVDS